MNRVWHIYVLEFITSETRSNSSSKLLKTMTGAVIPSGGVPMLLPSPNKASSLYRGRIMNRDSLPL